MKDVGLWILLIAIASWLVLGGLFFAYPTVYRLKDKRDEFGWIVKVPIYLWLIVGLLADICFNATWGTWIFRELPRETIFTKRLKRHWHGTDDKQRRRAAPWVRRVNAIDPGHV